MQTMTWELNETYQLHFMGPFGDIHILHSCYQPKITGHILRWENENVCLYSWDYIFNHSENEDKKTDHIHTIEIVLGLYI